MILFAAILSGLIDLLTLGAVFGFVSAVNAGPAAINGWLSLTLVSGTDLAVWGGAPDVISIDGVGLGLSERLPSAVLGESSYWVAGPEGGDCF